MPAPSPFPEIGAYVLGERIPVPSKIPVRRALDGAGRRWIRKGARDIDRDELFAEAVGWQLGRVLGVRVPDSAWSREPRPPPAHDGDRYSNSHADDDADSDANDVSWFTREVELVKHWTAADAARLVNHEEVAAMLVLDVLIANEDRHSNNVLVEAVDEGVRLWAIDAGNAAVAYPAVYTADLAMDISRHIGGLPFDRIDPLVDRAVRAAEALTKPTIDAMFEHASFGCVTTRWTPCAIAFHARCRNARPLVHEYMARLRGIR